MAEWVESVPRCYFICNCLQKPKLKVMTSVAAHSGISIMILLSIHQNAEDSLITVKLLPASEVFFLVKHSTLDDWLHHYSRQSPCIISTHSISSFNLGCLPAHGTSIQVTSVLHSSSFHHTIV